MKYTSLTQILFIVIIFLSTNLASQTSNVISSNNVLASFSSDGIFCSKDTLNTKLYGQYEVPKGSGIKSIFTSAFWLTALDTQNNIRGAANMYFEERNFRFGPVASNYSPSYDSTYNRVFKVTRDEVLNHILHYSDVGYSIPKNIRQWPGNGNITNGEANTLAPFIDVNNNQIYEPQLGEYPEICGDQTIFLILNDDRDSLKDFNCQKMKSEIHFLIYSLSSQDTALSNSIFFHVRVFNRSLVPYHNLYFSNFVDPDLGCPNNDRIGCDTSLDCFFVYNDPILIDTGSFCSSPLIKGYGRQKVAQGFAYLNRKLSSFKTGNGEGPFQSYPTDCNGLRNWQLGRWLDGLPVTYGGKGRGGAIATPYQFAGDPSDTTVWSELHSQTGVSIAAGDRREIGSISIDSLNPGQFQDIDMAYITSFTDSSSTPLSEISKLKADIQYIRSLYRTNLVCSKISGLENVSEEAWIQVYPNPAYSWIKADIFSARNTEARISVMDIQGKVIISPYTVNVGNGRNSYEINIRELASSIYFLNIQLDGFSSTQKFIKYE